MKYFSLILFSCLLLFSFGCNKGLRTEYIEGVVTLDNSPVDGALVTFIPNGADARIATGKTDAQGKYVLTTPEGGKQGKGTTAGEYFVTVAKREAEEEETAKPVAPSPSSGGPPSAGDMANRGNPMQDMGLAPPFAYLTPKKYNSVSTSGFTATVARGRNKFDFAMVSE